MEESVKFLKEVLMPEELLTAVTTMAVEKVGLPAKLVDQKMHSWIGWFSRTMGNIRVEYQLALLLIVLSAGITLICVFIPWWGRGILGLFCFEYVGVLWGQAFLSSAVIHLIYRTIWGRKPLSNHTAMEKKAVKYAYMVPALVSIITLVLHAGGLINSTQLIVGHIGGCVWLCALLLPTVALHANSSAMVEMLKGLIVAIGIGMFLYMGISLQPSHLEFISPLIRWIASGFKGRWEEVRDNTLAADADYWVTRKVEENFARSSLSWGGQARDWFHFVGSMCLGQQLKNSIGAGIGKFIFRVCTYVFVTVCSVHDGAAPTATRSGEQEALTTLRTKHDLSTLKDVIGAGIARRVTNVFTNRTGMLIVAVCEIIYGCCYETGVETITYVIISFAVSDWLIVGVYKSAGLWRMMYLQSVNSKIATSETPEVSSEDSMMCGLTVCVITQAAILLLFTEGMMGWCMPLGALIMLWWTRDLNSKVGQLYLYGAFLLTSGDFIIAIHLGYVIYKWRANSAGEWNKPLFKFRTVVTTLTEVGGP